MTEPYLLPDPDAYVRLFDGSTCKDKDTIHIELTWESSRCRSHLTHKGSEALRIKEVVLWRAVLPYSPQTPIYGEGYNMLSQYKGTWKQLELIGQYGDRDHYKMPQDPTCQTVYNLAVLSPEKEEILLLAFSSCRRFAGEFRFGEGYVEAVLDTEGLVLHPGQTWELEELIVERGAVREDLLTNLAQSIQIHHPALPWGNIPTGWCSWYCYGPAITEEDIVTNMRAIRTKAPELTYIQIDDGYQAYMGDWLIPHPSFAGNVQSLCRTIKEEGFEPAIWVAPFIAEEQSELFRSHPEWFVKDANGKPLLSSDVSFGGWRNGPWYMLDGTHPGARQYLREVFATIREQWGCRYFKLDANMWGALHGGYYYNPEATRVEAYRQGMEAVLVGAGEDSFLLGCNAPMWPSLGLVHGMRVTDDIFRDWETISRLAEQGFLRNWQHKRLWINDPDCLVLNNSKVQLMGPDGLERTETASHVTDEEFQFHATYMYASGGMVLASDKMHELSEKQLHMLHKCLPPTGVAAVFDDRTLSIGRMELDFGQMICVFNWTDEEQSIRITLPKSCLIMDYWSEEELGRFDTCLTLDRMAPHSARLLHITP